MAYQLDLSTSNIGRILNMPPKNSDYTFFSLTSGIYVNRIETNILNFNMPQYLDFNIANISNDVINSSSSRNKQYNFIIPMSGNTNPGGYVEYEDYKYDIRMQVRECKITYLDIELTTDYDELFNNNDINWYCLLAYDN